MIVSQTEESKDQLHKNRTDDCVDYEEYGPGTDVDNERSPTVDSLRPIEYESDYDDRLILRLSVDNYCQTPL